MSQAGEIVQAVYSLGKGGFHFFFILEQGYLRKSVLCSRDRMPIWASRGTNSSFHPHQVGEDALPKAESLFFCSDVGCQTLMEVRSLTSPRVRRKGNVVIKVLCCNLEATASPSLLMPWCQISPPGRGDCSKLMPE